MAVFGKPPESVADVRYQLPLHGAAATVILAKERRHWLAIFVVYEFRSSSCSARKLRRNHEDLEGFVRLLGGKAVETGKLTGPFHLPGGKRISSQIELFIGKAVRRLS